MQQLLLDLLPLPTPSFENFIPGRNAAVLAALRAWLDGRDNATGFLLWGELHSGRKHLLRASGGQWVEDPASIEALPPDAVQASPASPAFFCKCDVDALDEGGQIALFNLFNRLKLSGGKLLLSSAQPPAALAVREDLRTRLGSGQVWRLEALSDEEKREALRERARVRGFRLPEEVIDYLFRTVRRDMGTLMALLDALDRFTLEHKRAVTVPLVRTLLQNTLQNPLEV